MRSCPSFSEGQVEALDVQFGVTERLAGAVWRIKLSYAAEAGDRVSAYLCLPPPSAVLARPALLCLHGTTGGDGGIVGVPGRYGKDGKKFYGAEGDDPGMHYGLYGSCCLLQPAVSRPYLHPP